MNVKPKIRMLDFTPETAIDVILTAADREPGRYMRAADMAAWLAWGAAYLEELTPQQLKRIDQPRKSVNFAAGMLRTFADSVTKIDDPDAVNSEDRVADLMSLLSELADG